jgi:cbb3-type cytochrome oxidase subunit 3
MYTNTEQIIKDFDLKVSLKEELRKELKKKLKDCHPDKVGGEFKTTEQKEYFEKISSAIDFLDTPVELSIRQDIGDLARIVKDLAQIKNENNFLYKKEESLATRIDSNVKNYVSTHLFPKIGSSIITGILSMLWFFPKSISEHEVLSRYIDVKSIKFTLTWALAIILTCCIWLILNMLERKETDRRNNLKLESIQNKLFDDFLRYMIHEKPRESDMIEFTKENFINFIRGFDKKTHRLSPRQVLFNRIRILLGNSKIDIGLAQDLSEIILNRMQTKEIIKIISQKTISDIFIFELDENLRNYYH